MNHKLAGVIVPAATPFDESGRLRLDWFEHNMHRWASTKARGVMVLGTNGEFRALDDEESISVVASAAQTKSDLSLIVGVGRESTKLTQKFIDRVAEYRAAVDYVSVLPPHYFARTLTGSELHAYYTEIADTSPIPVLMYVAPSYSNNLVIPPSVVADLADHSNIAGIKDTSNDQMTAYMMAAGGRDDFEVLAGTMNTIMTGIYFGSRGGVVSAANYFPNECAAILEKACGGQRIEAIDAYKGLQALIKATGGSRGVASVKGCMNELGYRAGVPRRPLLPLDVSGQQRVRAALAAANKIG